MGALGFQIGVDYEKYESARKLSETEYTLNPTLGYISLNTALNNDEVLAVAFQYTMNGKTYQVGEFSTDGIDGQKALFLKLLKGTTLITNIPTWDLMMKNVYSLGAYNISSKNFFLDIWYLNPETGFQVPFIPEGSLNGKPLIQVLNLDRINQQQQPNPDGVFDYISGVTINPNNGRIYFPVLEPFGSHLAAQFSDPNLAAKYTYDTLYRTTQQLAKQDANKNRFIIKGEYSSNSSSDISLNAMNIPQGSVVVTAGGATLTENIDYTVDYNLGRVKIINESILQSGTPIKISLESNALFSIQSKTLWGSRFDYKFNKDFIIGGTILNLTEKPLTPKVNIGNEPISNTIWGLDISYNTESRFITRMLDKLPFYDTKAPSKIQLSGEFAHLIPGNPRAITKGGVAYIDDFEGSQSSITLNTFQNWKLASTPQGQTDLFPEANYPQDTLLYNYNRAKLAWYVIDPLFWRNDSRTPDHIKNDPQMQSNHFMREVLQTEVFPNKSIQNNINTNIPVLDLAFYPSERGQYNFDVGSNFSAGLNPDGTLAAPSTRWGGIMRKIETTDFASSNVQFIQFWVMDPFNDDADPTLQGGDLYFNLGNISEDILKDSRKAFENGLPTSANVINVDTTVWGRVPNVQTVVNAFDNDPDARQYQDVGLDGLSNADEKTFFPAPYNSFDDPAADDYHFYRGDDYDQQQLSILERYKQYNGMEGNSPAGTDGNYSTSNTTMPDIEDINQNNSLDTRESYFQYKVSIRPQDMVAGQNYITNILETTVKTPDGRTRNIKWYQFKIPIEKPDKVVGDIQDFKSIRFIRMFLKGFNAPVVLRFAQLDLVRGQWRNYTESLLSPGDYLGNDDDGTSFIIGAVNVEENSNKQPVNYVLPPGIQRELNPTYGGANNLQQLNEQALVLDVCNLKDGDARAGYKTLELDIRRYKKLKMFIHAESKNGEIPIQDNEVSVFVRLGTDFNDNYYEYEIPLKVTPPGYYDPNSESDQKIVWPEENNMEINLQDLIDLKKQRNQALIANAALVAINKPYEGTDGKNIIRVKGNPNLANVKMIMIGVRNPRAETNKYDDDGLPKCVEVWVNELRLAEFDNQGGWATTARATTTLADLGNINLAGNYSTPGFGSIDQKVNERQQEIRRSYDLSTSIELGKLMPKSIGISLPIYYNVSEGRITQRYNPLDPDVELNDLIKDKSLDKAYRDSIARRTETYTKRRTLTFTNVRKLPSKNKKKTRFYDISNWSFTYAYTENFLRDYSIEFDTRKSHRGGIAYNFNNNPKNYKPFSKAKWAKKKSLKFIKDFNFYLLPKQFSFNTTFDRQYSERQNRNNTGFDFELPTYYQKNFTWNRTYSLKYDLTKSLKFSFQATNNALIGEPQGRVDKRYKDEYNQFKDSVMASISQFGINTQYHHSADASYNLPFSKLRPLNWINGSVSYTGGYDWKRAPIGADTLGHTIQNSNTLSLNTQLNFTKLYNKIPYLKGVNARANKRKPPKSKKKKSNKNNNQANTKNNNKKPDPKAQARILKLEKKLKKLTKKKKKLAQKVGDIVQKQKDGKLTDDQAKPKLDDLTAKQKALDKEIKEVNKELKKLKKNNKRKKQKHLLDPLFNILMSVKNVSGTYTQTNGTQLPGYKYTTYMMGYDQSFSAPGLNFIAGVQDPNFPLNAARNGWLQDNTSLLYSYNNTFTENLNVRATLQPLKALRINLTATRNYAENLSRQFFWNDSLPTPDYDFGSPPAITGNFSMSYYALPTAFFKDSEDDYSNPVFTRFLDNRQQISQILGEQNPNSTSIINGYYDGYGETQQEVLIHSFITTYSGKDAAQANTKSFLTYIPKPNWRITYDGLSKIPLFQKWFRKITVSHAYRSTLNISSFVYNLNYVQQNGMPSSRDINNNFVPKFQINTVTISEQFSPLLNVDVTMKNSLMAKIEFKRDRNVSLSVSNNQVTEVRGKELVIGTGYKFKSVKMPFSKKGITSNLDTRLDLSIRNNRTIIRKVVENVHQLTAGQTIFTLKFTADYIVSKSLNIRLFFDKVINTPFISTTFPTSNTNAGISLRFTLSQ